MTNTFRNDQVDKILARIDKLNNEDTPATITAIKSGIGEFNNNAGGGDKLQTILNDLVAKEILTACEKDMGNRKLTPVYSKRSNGSNTKSNDAQMSAHAWNNSTDIVFSLQVGITHGKQITDFITSENAAKLLDSINLILKDKGGVDKLVPLLSSLCGSFSENKSETVMEAEESVATVPSSADSEWDEWGSEDSWVNSDDDDSDSDMPW